MSLSPSEISQLQGLFTDSQNSRPNAEINPLTYADSVGNTCLHKAAAATDLDALLLLIKGGVNVNAKNKDGYTPLDHALEQNSGDAICTLIEHGGSPAMRVELVRQWIKGVSGL